MGEGIVEVKKVYGPPKSEGFGIWVDIMGVEAVSGIELEEDGGGALERTNPRPKPPNPPHPGMNIPPPAPLWVTDEAGEDGYVEKEKEGALGGKL